MYVAGKLSPEERIGFEEHFVNCRQCLDQIELTDDLRGGLKQVAKEDAPRPGAERSFVSRQPSRASWTGIAIWQQPRMLAYATLVLAVGLSAGFFADGKYRHTQLAEARRAADDWQVRYTGEREARENLETQLAKSSDKTGDQSPRVANPEPVPLFFLNVTRGSEEGSPPANLVAVPSASPWIALSLEFEKDPAFRSYRARLTDAKGRVLWSAENIPSPPSGAMAITLPSHLLGKGAYSVALDGLTSAGRYLPAAHFSFQAAPQR